MVVMKHELGLPTDHTGDVHGSSLHARRNYTLYTSSQTDQTDGPGVSVASLQILFGRLEQPYFL